MRAQVVLPRLLGTRDAARDAIEAAHVPGDLSSGSVILMGARVASVSASYADELVKQLVDERGAREVLLVGASDHLTERLHAAAQKHDAWDRFRATTAVEAES